MNPQQAPQGPIQAQGPQNMPPSPVQYNGALQPPVAPTMQFTASQQPGQSLAAQVSNRRVISIVALLFSLIFGLVAINCSRKVDTALKAGDVVSAARYSKRALVWAITGIVIGSIFVIIRVLVPLSN